MNDLPRESLHAAGSRVFWLKLILAGSLAAGMALSLRLWLSASRTYPLAPVFSWMPEVPAPIDGLWLLAIFATLVLVVISWRTRAAVVALLILAGSLALWDQSRWQPWFFQYVCMAGALAIWKEGASAERQAAALDACRIIIAATYFWSGIHKLNPIYAAEGYPWLIEPLVAHLPAGVARFIARGALVTALLESGMGVGLLFRRTRAAAAVLAMLMHSLILISVGPLGHDWNTVVWPWNLAMIGFVAMLFLRTPRVNATEIICPRHAYHVLILVLFAIMPLLSFFDRWDTSLSASLYSGNAIRGSVLVSEAVRDRLPEFIRPHLRVDERGQWRVETNAWSLDELNVPAYQARRVHQAIARPLCGLADEPDDVVLRIRERPDFRTGERAYTMYDCEALRE